MSLERTKQFENLSPEEKFTFELLKRRLEEKYPELETLKNKENMYTLMVIFLRCKKWNVDGAFQKLSGLYSCRVKYPDIFHNAHPDSIAQMLKHWKVMVLKSPDKFGGGIFLNRVGTFSPKYGPFDLLISLGIFLPFHMHLTSPEVQRKGITAIYDYAGVGWKMARHWGPSHMYKSVDLILSAMPWKINEVHFVNVSTVSRGIIQAFKVLCPKKIADRFHIHSSLETLHGEFSPDILPEYLGGNLTEEEAGQDEYQHLESLSPDLKELYEELFTL